MSQKKIAVLLPQSKQYPTIAKDFMNGLKLSLKKIDYEYCVEGIGFGNQPETIINAIQKITTQNEISVITGILGHSGLSQILDYVESIDENLIYSDFGSTTPLNISNRTNVLCNSLDLYKATSLLGNYFLDNNIQKVATSSCYYESGYDFIKAMKNVLYASNKASFAGHFITPLHPRENEALLMKEFMSETEPDAIFAFHNGIYAKEHASYISENKINKKTPLYTLPFTVEETILKQFPEIFHQTKVVTTWFKNMQTKENKTFVKNYMEEYGKEPNIFAVLGYENGLLIKNEIEHSVKENITTPRGILNINKKLNRTEPKQQLWEIIWNGKSYEYKHLNDLTDKFETLYTESDKKNGWHNAYLCH